jgi:hypothetical protein
VFCTLINQEEPLCDNKPVAAQSDPRFDKAGEIKIQSGLVNGNYRVYVSYKPLGGGFCAPVVYGTDGVPLRQFKVDDLDGMKRFYLETPGRTGKITIQWVEARR